MLSSEGWLVPRELRWTEVLWRVIYLLKQGAVFIGCCASGWQKADETRALFDEL